MSGARVFAYGTLEVAEIVEAILGRPLRGETATLRGFARSMVRGTQHPGIEPRAGALTPGTLYAAVDDAALAALDRFEGALYERLAVEVETSRGERVAACAWAVRPERRSLLTGEPWDRERFVSEHLRAWLAGLSGPWRG